MFTNPPASDILLTRVTRGVSTAFFREIAAAGHVVPLYVVADLWTTTAPVGGTAPPQAWTVSPETFSLLVVGGTPSPLGEGWTSAAGTSYRLVACQDVAGARHGIAVQVGPGSPPVL